MPAQVETTDSTNSSGFTTQLSCVILPISDLHAASWAGYDVYYYRLYNCFLEYLKELPYWLIQCMCHHQCTIHLPSDIVAQPCKHPFFYIPCQLSQRFHTCFLHNVKRKVMQSGQELCPSQQGGLMFPATGLQHLLITTLYKIASNRWKLRL